MSAFQPFFSAVSPLWAAVNGAARAFAPLRAKALPCPVISVGNIIAGGVGKTEVVAYIASGLVAKGKRVVIAMRGYGSPWQAAGGIASDFSDAQERAFPDEALVLLRKSPGVMMSVGADRYGVLMRHWDQLKPDVVILDDGLQHFKLKRDVDVVVHDFSVSHPILRDFRSVMDRADARIAFSPPTNDLKDWAHAQYRIEGVVGSGGKLLELPKAALVFCGIGNPDRFTAQLEKQGVRIEARKFFPDHVAYTPSLVRELNDWQVRSGLPLVTTLKDQVKLEGYMDSKFQPLWVAIRLELLTGEAELWEKIEGKVKS